MAAAVAIDRRKEAEGLGKALRIEEEAEVNARGLIMLILPKVSDG